MKKKSTTKLTAAAVDALLAARDDTPAVIQLDGEVAVTAKRFLSLSDFSAMVQLAADMVFVTRPDGSTEYFPAFRRVALDFALLSYATDLNRNLSAERVYALCAATDLADQVRQALDPAQYGDFSAAADELIRYRRDQLLSIEQTRLAAVSRQLEAVSESFSALAGSFEGVDLERLLDQVKILTAEPEAEAGETE